MGKKYKLTGFARLLVFIILFSPVAYIGAQYINGENGIEKIKSIFQPKNEKSPQSKIKSKSIEIKKLRNRIEVLERDIKRLEAEL